MATNDTTAANPTSANPASAHTLERFPGIPVEVPPASRAVHGRPFPAYILAALVNAIVTYRDGIELTGCGQDRVWLTIDGKRHTIEVGCLEEQQRVAEIYGDLGWLTVFELCHITWGGGYAGGNCTTRRDACVATDPRQVVHRFVKFARAGA